VLRKTAFLPNEANFSGCYVIWITLMDNALGVQLRQFVTWLRFTKIGFVWGFMTFESASETYLVGSLGVDAPERMAGHWYIHEMGVSCSQIADGRRRA
jgi:hypothetical protein